MENTEPTERVVTFQCPMDLYERLREAAEDEDRSLSAMVRRLISKGLER